MAVISLTTGATYTQSFNALATTGTTNNMNLDPQPLPGWFINETLSGTRDNEQYAADTGGSGTGDTYSYGSAPGGVPSTERALGTLQSSSLLSTFGAVFSNDTGATITELLISFTGEQWRIGNIAGARDDRLDFQISTNATSLTTGTWTDVNQLDFTNLVKTATSAGALDGNLAANQAFVSYTITGLSIAPGATFWIRWNDFNAAGSDDGLAIDDFSLTPTTATGQTQTVTFSPTSVVQNEGNSGTTAYTFSVTRSGGTTGQIDFSGTIAAGSTDGADFVGGTAPTSFSGSIPAGQTSVTVTVNVQGDFVVESDESFTLTLTSATNTDGTVTVQIGANNAATGTITNDDGPGSIFVDDVTVTEGDSGTTAGAFTVRRTGGATGTVSVDYVITLPGGAGGADGSDVSGTLSGTVTFTEGQTVASIPFTINGDITNEPNETFTVALSNPQGGATIGDASATATITNDDAPPVIAIGDVSITEGASGVSYLTFTVSLSKSSIDPVTVDYSTANGTATAGTDYLAVSGTLSFAPGELSKTISVPIVGDTVPEANETFTVNLANPSGATLPDTSALGTITNDDGSAYFPLASGNFSENWTDTNRITTNDNWSGVPYVIGYLGDIVTGDPTGIDPRTYTGASLGAVDVIANQTNPGTSTSAGQTSGGVAEFQPTADPATTIVTNPTIAIQGSATADAPGIVLYMDASGRTDIRLEALLRDLDASADDAAQQINVQYRTDPNGAWINVPGGYLADVTTAGSATQTTALDVTLPAGANNAGTLQIRIMTTNAGGSDEWVGIDDIVVSSNQSAPSYTIADAAVFEGTGGTTPITFTVTRSGDTSAAGTVNYAVTFPGGGFSADAADFAGATSGVVSFAAGESSKTITLDIAADANPEADEAFTVTLSSPSAGSIADATATGTIVNDDGAPPFVTIADVVQSEGNAGTTTFTFTVIRTGGSGAFQVNYATTGTGTATPGVDYVATSGTLTFAAGDNSESFTVTVNGDTAGELAETFGVQLSNPTNFAVLADPTATGTIQNDDLLFIHQIQGSSYYSPILKAEGLSSFNTASTTTVVVQAIVTAVDNEGNRQGFYITEESGHWDADSLTSEGIFVMTRDDDGNGIDVAAAMAMFGLASLAAGHLVTVSAKVMEYQYRDTLPRTMLVNPSAISVNSTGNEVPKLLLDASRPIPNSILTLVTPDLTDSVGNTFDATRYALSFWETVEHMVVTIPDMVVADGFVDTAGGQPFFKAYSTVHADADQINSRGGYTVAGDPPNSPPDTADLDDDTIAGGRHVHDGDINPDIIEIDFTGAAIDAPAGLTQQATMGDALGDVTGIVEFDFEDLKLIVTEYDAAGFVNNVPGRETTTLGNDSRALTVATFNVENLAPNQANPADTSRFDAIAEAIATNLNSPDIIMIEEIQDNNGTGTGTTDASVTWGLLVAALNARVPGARYQWVDQPPASANADGGQGNGNIRVGFLYDTNRVQLGNLAWDAPIEDRRKYTDRIGDGVRDAGDLIRYSDDMVAAEIETANWTNTRKSLLAQFTFAGQEIFLVANHFTAKSGSGDIWQAEQNLEAGVPANDSWNRRNEQAHDVYAMINYIQTNGPGAGVISGGDYNDFYFYRPLEIVTGYVLPDGTARSGGARFDNLTLLLPEAERFSYTFDGRSQALDHIISSQNLAAIATYDIVHINTGYNSRGTGADADPSLSDHDPAVASFDFRSLSEVLAGTAAADTIEGFGGDDRLTGGDGNDTIDGGVGNDTVDYSAEAGGGDVVVNLSSGQVFFGVQPGHARDSYGDDDTLISIENVITGAGNDKVLGSTGANRIETGAGNDYIDGNGGTDTMIGGGGDDVYLVDSADDAVTEAAAGGTDEVRTALSVYTLPDQVENLAYTGTAPVRFTGNSVDNRMTGTAGNDFFLLQQGGNDTVSGLAGNDIFFFGAALTAADVVDGGADYDTVAIQGDYSFGLVLTANVTGIEAISLLSGANARFGDTANNRYDYDITVDDANFNGGMVKINGGNLLAGEDFEFDGAAEDDARFLIYGGFGEEDLTGGQQSDIFFFDGGTFQIGDEIDGSGGYDGLFLRGNYNIDFTDPDWETPFTNIENITVTSVTDTRYASDGGGPYSYSIVFADHLLGAGQTLTVNGALLQSDEVLNFDGSLEQQGNFRIFGGGGNDVLRGGLGNDLIYGDGGADTMSGGGGNDLYRYDEVSESTEDGRDSIQDFTLGDIVDLFRIDADVFTAGDQAFQFVGTAAFTRRAGELRYENEAANIWKVQGDVDGDGNADLELFLVITDGHTITAADFIL